MHSESFPKRKVPQIWPLLDYCTEKGRENHGALLGNLSIEMYAGDMEGTQRDAEVGSR